MAAKRKKPQKHTSRADRALILDEYKASGLTQGAYAKQKGVNVNTLVSWLREARKGDKPNGARAGRRTAASGRFVEAAASSASSPATRAGAPASLDGLDVNELRALVRQQAAVIARFI